MIGYIRAYLLIGVFAISVLKAQSDSEDAKPETVQAKAHAEVQQPPESSKSKEGGPSPKLSNLLTLQVGESTTIDLKKPTERIQVDTDDFVSLFMSAKDKLQVTGKAGGFTELKIRNLDGSMQTLAVRVESAPQDVLENVVTEIKQYLGDIPGVSVDIRGDKVVMSGNISPALSSYLNTLDVMYPDLLVDLVSRRIEAPPPSAEAIRKQIELEEKQKLQTAEQSPSVSMAETAVRVDAMIVEVSKNRSDQLGIEWLGTSGQVEFNADATASYANGASPQYSGSINLTTLSPIITALERKGYARTLATPKLTVENGKKADFLVGGEYPITQTTAVSSSTDYKKFGTQLQVAPIIRDNDRIFIEMTATISSLDFSVATPDGNPVVRKKEATTNVTLKNGETFALAGLTSRELSNNDNGIPFFSDIPLLGRAFKKESSSTSDTETIIFLTAYIVEENSNSGKPQNEIEPSEKLREAQKKLEEGVTEHRYQPPVKEDRLH